MLTSAQMRKPVMRVPPTHHACSPHTFDRSVLPSLQQLIPFGASFSMKQLRPFVDTFIPVHTHTRSHTHINLNK